MKGFLGLLFLVCMATLQAAGQTFYVPTTRTYNTPYGTFKHTEYVPSRMNYYYGSGVVSARYPFTVVLKNDSTFTAKTKITLGEEQHSLKIKNGKEKREILPNDTREISRKLADGSILKGIPADSCWLFKAREGKINSYSNIAEKGTSYISAVQAGEGPIVPMTKENVLSMVEGNEEAIKYAEKNKLLKAIEIFNRPEEKKLKKKSRK